MKIKNGYLRSKAPLPPQNPPLDGTRVPSLAWWRVQCVALEPKARLIQGKWLQTPALRLELPGGAMISGLLSASQISLYQSPLERGMWANLSSRDWGLFVRCGKPIFSPPHTLSSKEVQTMSQEVKIPNASCLGCGWHKFHSFQN